MSNYPLFFTLREIVMGNGFIVGLEAQGRALVTEEEDGFWIYGVNPGGIGGGGDSVAEAYREFRRGFLFVLYDIAADVVDFENFRQEAERVFRSVCEKSAWEWEEAVKFVRENKIDASFLKLSKKADATRTEVYLKATEIPHPAAEFNDLGIDEQLLAA